MIDNNVWILTHSGRRVSLYAPKSDDICTLDIAHHLGRIGRFTGAGDKYISVAQHCIHVSMICPPEYARWALLHDASEAYLTDVNSPLKKLLRGIDDLPPEVCAVLDGALDTRTLEVMRELLPGYRKLQRRFDAVISSHYGVPIADVKHWDTASTLAERRDNGPHGCDDASWVEGCCAQVAPHSDRVVPVSPEMATWAWIWRAQELGL